MEDQDDPTPATSVFLPEPSTSEEFSADQNEFRSSSPEDEMYRLKMLFLKEKYDIVAKNTDRLRGRMYHIKREISKMKRLKRILIGLLASHGDTLRDTDLEIPDDIVLTEDADSKRRRERREKERERKEALKRARRSNSNSDDSFKTENVDDDLDVKESKHDMENGLFSSPVKQPRIDVGSSLSVINH